MLRAVRRALETYHQSPERWQELLTLAMRARDRRGYDFTWTTAANRYLIESYEMGDQTESDRYFINSNQDARGEDERL
jgi:glycogen synthase